VADLDPQGNASTGMGIRHDAREVTVYDVVVSEAEIQEAIVHTPVERLHAVPATIDLAGAEIELVSQFSRESRLKKAIEPVLEGAYDFILLDCPPSLGLLTSTTPWRGWGSCSGTSPSSSRTSTRASGCRAS
jgi:chromosome partitioning protein